MYPFMPSAKAFAQQEARVADVEDAVSFLKIPLSDAVFANVGRHVVLYALAKAMLSCCSQATKNRLAAEKAREYVARITQHGEEYNVGKTLLPSLEKEGDGYCLSLQDYLKHGENLVQQGVHDGRVSVAQDELNALLQKAIQEKLTDAPMQNVPEEIRAASLQLEPPAPARQYKSRLLSLACMQNAAKGVDEGKRFYGAFGLSIAAKRDGLTREQTLAMLTDYVGRCRGTKPFTLQEAKSVLDWVYVRSIGFSCRHTMDNGFEGDYCTSCPLNWKRRK